MLGHEGAYVGGQGSGLWFRYLAVKSRHAIAFAVEDADDQLGVAASFEKTGGRKVGHVRPPRAALALTILPVATLTEVLIQIGCRFLRESRLRLLRLRAGLGSPLVEDSDSGHRTEGRERQEHAAQ